MTFPKFLVIATALLFTTIGVLAFFKTGKTSSKVKTEATPIAVAIPILLEREVQVATQDPSPPQVAKPAAVKEAVVALATNSTIDVSPRPENIERDRPLPNTDRIYQLFNKGEPKLPFVETITYKSRVSWLKGRPAWLSDYASHYSSSRHFIARSLNGKPDYLRQNIAEGDTFNVFRKDKNINFHLLVDTSRCKLWLYAIDVDANKRFLLKSYQVGLGRPDGQKASGLLTPLGKYSLGSKVMSYEPKMEGHHNGQKVEMVRIFGSRWIPFEKEVTGCTVPAKGFGIHGVPWAPNKAGVLAENCSSLGKYEGDGCVRLATADIEELFAILITKPTVIELVNDFFEAKLPGIEITE
ncbi:MAG: L,D-transpeptidase [Parachlamydiaceae bacterium]|nr:L,D-transpeptidase [Parachlamydiaceae bacterium]